MANTLLGDCHPGRCPGLCSHCPIGTLRYTPCNYAINSVNCGGNALSYLYDLCNDTDLVILQRPVVFGEAYTKHNIIYNDGEFKGCFDDYTDFMLAKSMEGYKE